MDKLTNQRLLNMPTSYLPIGQGFFLKFSSIEIVDMMSCCLGATSFDELSSLHNLTHLFIRVDSSSIFNRDHTWMERLKRFCIEVGDTSNAIPTNKSTKMIIVSHCETFSNGELSGMLQFASHLYLENCGGLRKLVVNKKSTFIGLKSLRIYNCCCDFGAVEEGISGQIDPLPNLEYLSFFWVDHLKSVSDFVGSVPKQLEEITIHQCVL
ncbi:hypothetical protein KY290_033066 [Solanum tuberosum]|uniref:Uncharacterized protein n=1 Tax=Solanum tuberosum TaxID=4113 RepID=A0ABQ7TZT4_SOLTU|nr:hypothetical protein KY285_032315 [Solanum tuberosum]KAH0740023.1 hypothetical protein KY290_033066 [Solanum tuberosum]